MDMDVVNGNSNSAKSAPLCLSEPVDTPESLELDESRLFPDLQGTLDERRICTAADTEDPATGGCGASARHSLTNVLKEPLPLLVLAMSSPTVSSTSGITTAEPATTASTLGASSCLGGTSNISF